MNNTRKLMDYINEFYNEIQLTDEQKMVFETGVAKGIGFALTQLIDVNIDLSILGQCVDKIKE